MQMAAEVAEGRVSRQMAAWADGLTGLTNQMADEDRERRCAGAVLPARQRQQPALDGALLRAQQLCQRLRGTQRASAGAP